MSGLFDPAYYWIPLGFLAFGFVIINIIRTFLGKRKGWQVLMFLSLSCGLLEVLAQYQMIHKWVNMEDWAALLDVVPSMSNVLMIASILGIALNGMVFVLNYSINNKETKLIDMK